MIPKSRRACDVTGGAPEKSLVIPKKASGEKVPRLQNVRRARLFAMGASRRVSARPNPGHCPLQRHEPREKIQKYKKFVKNTQIPLDKVKRERVLYLMLRRGVEQSGQLVGPITRRSRGSNPAPATNRKSASICGLFFMPSKRRDLNESVKKTARCAVFSD